MSENQSKTYNIGEAAKMFKVATSLIRYWESEFDILNPGKDEKGNRVFSNNDIKDLQLIYHLVKERGFTLQGAKQELENRKKTPDKYQNIKADLLKVRDSLTQIKNEIDSDEG